MKIVDLIGVFVSGLIGVAALSLVVAPDSGLANVVKAMGDAGSKLISSAKQYPTAG